MLHHDLYRHSLGDLLLRIVKNNPDAAEKDIREEIWPEIKKNEAYIRLLFDNWFNANYPTIWIKQHGEHSFTITKPTKKRESPEEIRKIKKAQKYVSDGIESLANMALEQLFPAVLRMKFGECAKLGGRFVAVSKLGKAHEIVGRKLTEKQLRIVWFQHPSQSYQKTHSREIGANT